MPIQRISHSTPLEFGSLIESSFGSLLRKQYSSSRKVIIVDENTHEHCLNYLLTQYDELAEAEIIMLPTGEENKVLEVCAQVWETLSSFQISRHDLIINLGGGLVTDMGGFIASIYKRGMDFIQVPTSLLGMVDASIGGKTGIDLGPYKNQLGMFAQAKALYIDPLFLNTLPAEEMKNAYAEMLKHALISSRLHWNELKKSSYIDLNESLLMTSIIIKQRIVQGDPFEQGERKKLNLGHTIGHALEGLFLHSERQIKHGHAVALGLLCEAYISYKRQILSEADFEEIVDVISCHYAIPALLDSDFEQIHTLMLNDKKNHQGKINSVLLEEIGSCQIDQELEQDEIRMALSWLIGLSN